MTTLLQGVNRVLRRVQVIQGDSGELASLTDSARQTFIDTAVMVWNEAIHELYTTSGLLVPQEAKEDTITLITSTREYALPVVSGIIERIHWPLMDQTNGRRIDEYPGGYEAMFQDQLQPANYTGLPLYAAINPTNDKIRLDRVPTAAENGLVYRIIYDRQVRLTLAADTYPFTDTVWDALVPAVAELWKREQRNSFDSGVFGMSLGRAARLITRAPPRTHW